MKTLQHYIILTLITTVSIVSMMASCEDEDSLKRKDTATGNFELFWKVFDERYGLFDVKNIDWNEVYRSYRPRVTDTMSDASLYQVLTEMIFLLNDNHVNLYPTNGTLPAFPGGLVYQKNGAPVIVKVQEDYDADLIKNYVANLTPVTSNLSVGTLPGNIGYLGFKGTDGMKECGKALSRIMQQVKDTRGLIIDIRGNYGGSDAVSQFIASHFTSTRKLYMTTRKRNGPRHSDFEEPVQWHVEPVGDYQYGKPIVLLTSRFSQSAAETFALAMNELDHVMVMGDTTCGGYSDNPATELYNGWILSFSVGDFRAADGTSYEGKGMPPDIYIVNSKEDLLQGNDKVLEHAIQHLSR
jgi:carboxyl-terminal processing protease